LVLAANWAIVLKLQKCVIYDSNFWIKIRLLVPDPFRIQRPSCSIMNSHVSSGLLDVMTSHSKLPTLDQILGQIPRIQYFVYYTSMIGNFKSPEDGFELSSRPSSSIEMIRSAMPSQATAKSRPSCFHKQGSL
jgi:hypothetical protein